MREGKIDVASLICGLSEEDRWGSLAEWWLGGVLPGALADLSTEGCEQLCDLFKIMKTSKAAMRKAIAAMIERKLESDDDDEKATNGSVRGEEAGSRLAGRRGRSRERLASRIPDAPARQSRPGSRSASEEPSGRNLSKRRSPRLVQSAMELAMKLPDVGTAGRRADRGMSAGAQRSLRSGATRRRREESAVATSSSSAPSDCSSDSSWSSEDDEAGPLSLPNRHASKPHRSSRFSAGSTAVSSRSSVSSPLAPDWLDSVLFRYDSVERAYAHLSSGWQPRSRKEAQSLARIIDAIRCGRRADALEMAVRRLIGVHSASQPGGSWRIGDVLEGDVEEHSFLPAKVWARAVKHAASMEGSRSKEGYGSNRREKSPAHKKWQQQNTDSDKQQNTRASGSHKAKTTGSST